MLKCKQRLGIKNQFIMNRKRDANSNWYSSEVMKCRKLITATKTSRIEPCERTIRKLNKYIYIYIFFLWRATQWHSSVTGQRWEKHLLFGTHKCNEFVFFVQQKKDPPNGMCLYTGILMEFWKSGRVLLFCQCSGLQWQKQVDTSVIHPGQNNGRLVM